MKRISRFLFSCAVLSLLTPGLLLSQSCPPSEDCRYLGYACSGHLQQCDPCPTFDYVYICGSVFYFCQVDCCTCT